MTVITVALDKSADDIRPLLANAAPTHPSLLDSAHRVADLYNIVNVPTVVWIDESGIIARPNDTAFGSDVFKDMTGLEAAPHIEALKAWVRDGTLPFEPAEVRELQVRPTSENQLARAEFSLAWYLHRRGEAEAAEERFVRAGQLAPHDFTIRRGSLPIRGRDPMGPEFADMLREWTEAGNEYYRTLAASR